MASSSSFFVRHPSARWGVPAVAAAAIVGGTLVWPHTASADGLPTRSAEQLLVDVQQASVPGMSGTVTETANLGLPAIPGSLAGSAGASATSALGLLTGSHTARVWTNGESSRVALQEQGKETDIIHTPGNVWVWSSADKSVTHTLVPTDAANKDAAKNKASATSTPLTPQQIAQRAVQNIDKTTTISTASNDTVAGRSVYELVLKPKAGDTRVASVHIAIDGATKVPLRVQVFSTQTSTPAISVGFTSVDFSTPASSVFQFTPPAGAKVTTKDERAAASKDAKKSDKTKTDAAAEPTVVGTGWSSIAKGTIDLTKSDATQGASQAELLKLFPEQSGKWGTAHVLDGTLVSAVITTDGHYAIGAVAPSALLAALPTR